MGVLADAVRIDSLVDFLAWIEALGDGQDRLWYRGCVKPMVPSLYRNNAVHDLAGFVKLERDLTARFRQQWVPFQTRSLDAPWELLFIMQHYGVPTRLLDWTEAPYVGLYFALMAAASRDEAGDTFYPEDATLWVLDPVLWNGGQGLPEVVVPGDPRIPGYGDTPQSWNDMGEFPVAVSGVHNSTRIVAQRGVFTLFGKSRDTLDVLFAKPQWEDRALRRIVLPKDKLPDIRKCLFRLGITHSVLFPDLEHLGMDLRREFQFKE